LNALDSNPRGNGSRLPEYLDVPQGADFDFYERYCDDPHGDRGRAGRFDPNKIKEVTAMKIKGHLRMPLLLTADWSIGGREFSEQAFDELVADVRSKGVKDILLCGKILQGPSARNLELAAGYLKRIPRKTKVAMVSGTNGEALEMLAEKVPNATYYGEVATLKLGDFTLMAAYGKYASSRTIQEVYTKLKIKPNILVMGRFNGMLCEGVPHGRLLIKLGRDTSRATRHGTTAQLGWHILHEHDEEHSEIEGRYSRAY